ncbi:MAG: methyltransferase [Acidobacteria bacterium]|nr:methyltransferase [Acidobacteriota bacterium]
MDMAWGHFRARVLEVFATLQVADALAEGRDPGVNDRFLRASASLGFVKRSADGTYENTELGECLRTNARGSLRPAALAILNPACGHYKAWENLAYSAQTEGNAFVKTFGQDVWQYFTQTNPEEGENFNQTMRGMSEAFLAVILAIYELPKTGTIVDVAGGVGGMLCAFLNKEPGLRGILMDLEFTRAGAEAYIASQDLAERCRFEAGNFFQSVPAGGDLYTMKWILHDWNDVQSAAILKSLHAAMPAHAKLVLFEAVVPEDDSIAGPARMMDMNMMVMCGGKERTETQWRELLGASGFEVIRIIPTPTPNFVIEAVKK